MFKRTRRWPRGGLLRGFFLHDDRPIRYAPRFRYRVRSSRAVPVRLSQHDRPHSASMRRVGNRLRADARANG